LSSRGIRNRLILNSTRSYVTLLYDVVLETITNLEISEGVGWLVGYYHLINALVDEL
jgi:hypothetical protein